MAPPSTLWSRTLDDPLAIALAGLLLVLLSHLTPLGLPLSLLIAAVAAIGLVALRAHRQQRGGRLRDRRIRAGIEAALIRASQLADQAEGLKAEAMARFQAPDQLESLGLVQLCCDRLRELPARIQQRQPLLESGGGVLLSAQELGARLNREREALARETSATLRRERQRLVEQLQRNLDAAQVGMDERQARLLALSTRLEHIDGGLRQLQRQVERQWPSSEASGAAVSEAISPLNEALDQLDRLLDAGQR